MSKSKSYKTIEDEAFLEFAEDLDKDFSHYPSKDESFIIAKKEIADTIKQLEKDNKKKEKSKKTKNGNKIKRKKSSDALDKQEEGEEKTEESPKMNRNKHKDKGSKQWVHPPESLLRGHIVYNVKFLGNVEVDNPKGTEVVRDAIRKMKFNKQLKKAEGQKPPRVELTISVDGVTVQEPKIKIILHQYALHRISYCADDKTDKRMFTFIAKEAETNKHNCYVFDSDKCAEEITLTIGQAFDLAYRKFLDSSSKDIDMKKQYLLLQKKVQQLTDENLSLKGKVADLERRLDSKPQPALVAATEPPVVGRRLENLVLEDKPYTNGHNGTTISSPAPAIAPPPPVPTRSNPGTPVAPKTQGTEEVDIFGSTPFNPVTGQPSVPPRLEAPTTPSNPFKTSQPTSTDAFGMASFAPPTTSEIDQQISNMDKELMDLQVPWHWESWE